MPLPVKSLMERIRQSPQPGERAKEQFLGGMPWEAGRLQIKPDACYLGQTLPLVKTQKAKTVAGRERTFDVIG